MLNVSDANENLQIVGSFPWIPVFGFIISGLLSLVLYFLREAYVGLKQKDDYFEEKIVKVWDLLSNKIDAAGNSFGARIENAMAIVSKLSERVGNLDTTIQKHQESSSVFHNGVNKRLDEMHEEQIRTRDRLHDLENFQTKVQLKEDIEGRRKTKVIE